MNPTWQRRLHLGARALGWVAGSGVITLAVLMALAQLLLPLLARHPEWVARELSAKLQRPVSFASLEGRWTGSGPLFVLHDVTVGVPPGVKGTPIKVPESELRLDFGGWLPSRHLVNLRTRDLQLDLSRDADGRWHVNGLGTGGGAEQQPGFSQLSVALWLDNLRLNIADAANDKHYSLVVDQLRLSRQGNHIRVGALLHRAGVGGVVRGAGRFRDDGSDGRLWLSGQQVDLARMLAGVDLGGYTVQGGHGNVASWLDWQHGKVVRNFTRLDLDDLRIAGANGAVAVPGLHGDAELGRSADGYELRWAGDDQGALAVWLHHPGTPQLAVQAAARDLQLAPLLPWLGLAPNMSPALAKWLGEGHPRGKLDSVALGWTRAGGLDRLAATFSGLAIDPAGKLPGVDHLGGTLRGDGEAVSLELPAQGATLNLPHTFRQPFAMAKLGGTLAFWHADGDWHLGIDPLDFEGRGYGGQLRGEIALHDAGGPPFLDLYVALAHADVAAAKLFWPIDSMPAATVSWLDQALVGGRIDHGDVVVRGDLRDWPFHHNEGRFEARAEISDLTFHYGKDWPEATGVHAVASFVNSGMLVQADAGSSLGVKVDKATALIPEFGDGTLDLNVSGGGSGASLLGFVFKSPIASHQADALAKLKLGGSGSFDFHLSLPLAHAEDFTLAGTAQLKNVDVGNPDWQLQLDKLSGPATFDGHGFHAGPLSGTAHGEPSTLDLAIAGATGDPATALTAKLSGSYSFAELTAGYPSLDWLNPLGSGRSPFDIGFSLTKPANDGPLVQTLTLDSTLAGIALDVPVPLKKTAATELPLHLVMTLPMQGADLKIALGEQARGHLRLADGSKPLAGTLAFGTQMPMDLPAQGLRIRGHAAKLDVTGWVQQAIALTAGGHAAPTNITGTASAPGAASPATASGGPALESVDVGTDHAEWFGHPLGAMTLQATPTADNLQVDVTGPAMTGRYTVPTRELDKRGITARLTHLHWPGSPSPPSGKAAASQPEENPANTGIDPASLPPFHLWVGELSFGDAKLGEARLESWPTAQGMRIDQLRALSPSVQITGSGDWNGTPTDSHTRMRISFAADDLGKMLTAFGFTGLVNGGKTQDQLDASWPGAPSSFSLANATGTLAIQVSDGRIPEVGPGVGRLFGLVSLAELPRRLTLDFGDVFGKGLGFDSIKGDFQLANGSATTGNLVIKGPAAQIGITGRTGLRAKDYDQQVTVVPHIGNSLPVIGAVVGGPVGVAAGLAVQGLLGHGLNKTAGARYHVTGSWDKPVMTLVEKRSLPAAPTAPATVEPPLLPAAPSSSPAITIPLLDVSPALPASSSSR
ncbi:MAG: TIGR02099 family protein [Rhodanobacter sp. 68-29]|nr:TIGR02099 family protein [Rhodanobacter sp.]ODU76150.1 MAG: TIGR02099 family protein [Rhodanobacter sp. SCN 69-32]OJY62365.1 MAG: TIGR02099 family protein [Rhodanobacter sp. 68-29]